jgi:hypothetical protein
LGGENEIRTIITTTTTTTKATSSSKSWTKKNNQTDRRIVRYCQMKKMSFIMSISISSARKERPCCMIKDIPQLFFVSFFFLLLL